jgi:hypothetical protein
VTLFAIYNEQGEIDQAIKHFDPDGYDKLLDDRGLQYIVKEPSEGLIRPGQWYVDITAKELRERPLLATSVDKTVIKAGGGDSALITGIPREARVQIMAAGLVLHAFEKLDADQLEIAIPVPCTYAVAIDVWPYQTWRTTIEAL